MTRFGRYAVGTGLGAIVLAAVVSLLSASSLRADVVYDCQAEENRGKPTTIEIVLSQKWREQADEIKRALVSDADSVKVRVRFYPLMDPPRNIGIGKCVPADVARRAIQEAIKYSGTIDQLIRQDILPHHWIKIGSTDTAELAWMPVPPEDLSRLTAPNLSTDQFQELYRSLAAPKERRLPFGMGSQPIQPSPGP
ncbi:MAG: hypothetical protein AB1451_00620 [Nitrospirota bacterium]